MFSYTSEAINNFVDSIGVARRGNENMVSVKLLEHHIRADLDKRAPRTLVVIDPIKVVIENFKEDHVEEFETPLFPKNKELGTRKITLGKVIHIERTDFKDQDDPDFFGLTPHQEVGLKYAGIIKVKSVQKDVNGNVIELICEYSADSKKTKGRIHWISHKDAQKVEVRLYDYLFNSDDPMKLDEPLNDLNKNSLVIKSTALVNKNLLSELKPLNHFQFERVGYFVVDLDTDVKNQRYVFNLTVDL